MSFSADTFAAASELIARKRYAKAIKLLKHELGRRPDDLRLRLQLADVLVLSKATSEATPLLSQIADAYASEGFTAKAIAVLKKLQRVDPSRRDVEERLADLITRRGEQRHGTMPASWQFEGRVKRALAAADSGDTGADEPAPAEITHQTAEPALEAEPEPGADDEPILIIELDLPPAEPDLVTTPLFEGFSRAELIEVIRGLKARTFTAGDVIVLQDEPGDSLFIVTSGTVKAFVRTPEGGARHVRDMGEGSFFGEISFLSGNARTATVTAAGPVELLELDRPTVRTIAHTHPQVEKVLLDFYYERGGHEVAPALDADGGAERA